MIPVGHASRRNAALAASFAIILGSGALPAQVPGVAVLQNAFTSRGLAFAGNFGSSSGQSFFGAAAGWGHGERFLLSGAAGVQRSRHYRLEPVPVLENLIFEQVSRLEERASRPRGVVLEARPVRRYPAGAAVAHLVGYVGEISDRELQDPQWEGYRAGQPIGKGGVERAYERRLGGRLGARYVEVDARGSLVRSYSSQPIATPSICCPTTTRNVPVSSRRKSRKRSAA